MAVKKSTIFMLIAGVLAFAIFKAQGGFAGMKAYIMSAFGK